MRRLIQTPAHRRLRRRNAMSMNASTLSNRCHGSDKKASAGSLDAPQQQSQPTIPLPSRVFEIRNISSRHHLSSQAVQHHALSPRGAVHHDLDIFGVGVGGSSPLHTDGGVMLNPFLGYTRNKGSSDEAFLELFKALSSLNRQPAAIVSSTRCLSSVMDVEIPGGGMESHVQKKDKQLGANGPASSATGATSVAKDEAAANSKAKQQKRGHKKKMKQTTIDRFESLIKKFEEDRSSLDSSQLTGLFHHAVKSNLLKGFEVLKYYAERRSERGRPVELEMYMRVMLGIRQVRPVTHHSIKRGGGKMLDLPTLQYLVRDLENHILDEYSEGKKVVCKYILLPALAASLSEHNHPVVREYAKPAMERILDAQFPPLAPELFERVLGEATQRHTGPEYMPYHRVLSWLVSNGHKPKPTTVFNVLQCYHPFTHIEATHEVLSIVQKLHLDHEHSSLEADNYRVDLGTLESISMAASKKNMELVLLVWDLVESFGYDPTASMFEDVVMSFGETQQDDNMYAALVDMEKYGQVPSRALLRWVALKISGALKWMGRLDHSYNLLTWHEHEHLRSTHSLNALILGYGIKRDIDSAFVVYEDFERFDLHPDANTYTFLMEVLYLDTKGRFPIQANKANPEISPQDIEDVIGVTQVLLGAMEEAGIEKTKPFVHEYVRLLCALNLLDEANLEVKEAISRGTGLTISTLFMLATRFADAGNTEMAFAVSGLSVEAGCGELRALGNRIKNITDRNRPRV